MKSNRDAFFYYTHISAIATILIVAFLAGLQPDIVFLFLQGYLFCKIIDLVVGWIADRYAKVAR